METTTILLIILSVILAGGLAWFQYFHKNKAYGRTSCVLAILRFVGVMGALLLLINPQFNKREYHVQKSNLVVLADNSASLQKLSATENGSTIQQNLLGSSDLDEHFEGTAYHFGRYLQNGDSLSHQEPYTNISGALENLEELYPNTPTAVVLLTDGNQTIGKDYGHLHLRKNISVYPVVLGDTTQYQDLRITQVNNNNYAFLKNQFPIETFVQYQGRQNIKATYTISMDGKNVHSEPITLSPQKNNITLTTLLTASSVGHKPLKINVSSLPNERNTANNSAISAVDVIDERSHVLIVSAVEHPDLGALKKALESNEQRSVSLVKPTVSQDELEKADLVVLYQPNSSFKKVYDFISKKKLGRFSILGPHTDWNFLNGIQNRYQWEDNSVEEDLVPLKNESFSLFDVSNFSISDYPPLLGDLGDLQFQSVNEVLLGEQVRGVELPTPLLSVLPDGNGREAVLMGEGLWKWRMQTFRNDGDFQSFDELIGKLALYLSGSNNKERLVLDYRPTFINSSEARITAQYFDAAYEFDPNAAITITVTGADKQTEVPLLSQGNSYVVDLSDLPSGEYEFTVKVKGENLSKQGRFTIMDFDLEQQLVSSDVNKLQQLAQNNNGTLYYHNQWEQMIQDLAQDPIFTPLQKTKENKVSLIDYRLVLALMALAFSLEWFIRKYNGLI